MSHDDFTPEFREQLRKAIEMLPQRYCIYPLAHGGGLSETARRNVLSPLHADKNFEDGAAVFAFVGGQATAYQVFLENGSVADCDLCKHRLACLVDSNEDNKNIKFEPK